MSTATVSKWKCKYCGRTDFKRVQDFASHIRIDHKAEREKEQSQGEKLTRTTLLKAYPKIFERIHKMGGCGPAFSKHPDWKIKLTARGEPMQNVYDALTYYRQSLKAQEPEPVVSAPRKVGRPVGTTDSWGRYLWSAEQYALAKQILNDPQNRTTTGKLIPWEILMKQHPEWVSQFNYSPDNKAFLSFMVRVRQGKGPMIARPSSTVAALVGNGTHSTAGIVIAGREYQLLELEQIIRAQQNSVKPLNFCPNCGTNLVMHSKAFSIAKRHSNSEE